MAARGLRPHPGPRQRPRHPRHPAGIRARHRPHSSRSPRPLATRRHPDPRCPGRTRTGGMNPVDTATARKRLEEMHDDLERSIAVLKGEHAADEGTFGYPPDPADAGANLSEADRTLAILEAAQSQRSQVLAALDQVAGGNYGICTECGRPVPEGRLEARPEAARCVACQSKADRLRRWAAAPLSAPGASGDRGGTPGGAAGGDGRGLYGLWRHGLCQPCPLRPPPSRPSSRARLPKCSA